MVRSEPHRRKLGRRKHRKNTRLQQMLEIRLHPLATRTDRLRAHDQNAKGSV